MIMNEVEKKTQEISEKWKHKMQEQGVDKFTYKFYRQNQVELYEDFEDLWTLCKLEDLK
jgi:hypothetical protein